MATNKPSSSSSATKRGPIIKGERTLNFDPDYFVLPHSFFMIIIPFGLLLVGLSTFSPDSIPSFLGPVGALAKFLGHNYPSVCVFLSILSATLHVGEAVYAGKVCHDRGMTTSASTKWVLSTFVFGFSSLVFRLLPYKPNSKSA